MTRVGSLLVALAVSLVGFAVLQADVPRPEYPKGQGAQCVEPNDIMRRDHFRFLKHQRDNTVHLGIRTAKHSLVGCIDCHAVRGSDGQYVPVNDEGQFCQSCHVYSAVKIDCFTCHAAVPDSSPLKE
ncbi:MAG: cytochrome c3 family protein [Pseudomonadota bacterium]|nr:cytochrome c3 family protein [Pseudomonadota bacterium]